QELFRHLRYFRLWPGDRPSLNSRAHISCPTTSLLRTTSTRAAERNRPLTRSQLSASNLDRSVPPPRNSKRPSSALPKPSRPQTHVREIDLQLLAARAPSKRPKGCCRPYVPATETTTPQ